MNPKTIIITGDFNDRCSTWDSDHADSELGYKACNLIARNNLFQIINEPTRSTEFSNSLLDLLITDSPGYILDSGVLPPVANSDHSVIFCTISITFPNDKAFRRTVWDYKRGNFDVLNETLSHAPWGTGFDLYDTIEEYVDYWTKLFIDTAKEFIPCKDVLIRPKDKPWVTAHTKLLIRKRNRAWKKYKKSVIKDNGITSPVTERLFQFYKRCRNISVSANKKSIRTYFANLRSELDSREINVKKWWNLSKSILGCKLHPSIPPLIENDNIISNNSEKAEVFNQYFASQCRTPADDNSPQLPDFAYRTDARLDPFLLNENDVLKVTASLKTSSATGPDGLSNFLLKQTSPSISESLTRLFNTSLSASKFPAQWKKSNTCPVCKKANTQLKSNYRPISLLCNVSKVFERLVYNKQNCTST